jgi:hypothetical protein
MIMAMASVCEPELPPSLDKPVCKVSNILSNTFLQPPSINRLKAESASRTFETSKSLLSQTPQLVYGAVFSPELL